MEEMFDRLYEAIKHQVDFSRHELLKEAIDKFARQEITNRCLKAGMKTGDMSNLDPELFKQLISGPAVDPFNELLVMACGAKGRLW